MNRLLRGLGLGLAIVVGFLLVSAQTPTGPSTVYRNLVLDYRGNGNDQANNDSALSAAVTFMNARGGYTFVPRGAYRHNTVIPELTCKGCGFIGEGSGTRSDSSNAGPGTATGSVFRLNAATGNTLTIATTARGVVVRDIAFWPVVKRTSGFEIVDKGHHSSIDGVSCSYIYNCLQVGAGSVGSNVRRLRVFGMWGDYGVQYQGTGNASQLSLWSQGNALDDAICYNPYNTYEPAASGNGRVAGAWATGASVAQYEIRSANSYWWQANNAGTTLGSGSGPTITSLYTNAGDPTTTYFTDNGITWRMVGKVGNSCINFDGTAVGIWVSKVQALTTDYGFTISNGVGVDTPPQSITIRDSMADHNIGHGVYATAGYMIRLTDNDLVLSATGRGFHGTNGFTGELALTGNKVWKNALDGVLLPPITSLHGTVTGNRIVGNGYLTSDTYDGLVVGNATQVMVLGNFIGPAYGAVAGTQRYAINIGASADYFTIGTNNLTGNGTGDILNAAGRSATKQLPGGLSKATTLTRAFATASGDVAYTGCGFRPSAVLFFGGQAGGSAITLMGIADMAAATGPTGQQSMSVPGTYNIAANVLVLGSGGNDQTAVLKSIDATGFTLTWTKTGAPGGADATVPYLCLQ